MARFSHTKKELVADYGVFSVHRHEIDRDGVPVDRPIHTFETVDWANVVPVTREGKLVLVRLHRFGIQASSIEIPGGLVDEGEEPIVAARRELLEETGYVCDDIVPLGVVHANPALQPTRLHMFLAIGCTPDPRGQSLEELEDCEVMVLDRDEVRAAMKRGEISHALVWTALQAWELLDR